MPIREHPELGTVLMCDFNQGFCAPEMVKRRPVVVISPKISNRYGLCTIVCLSNTAPDPVMPYHCQIDIRPMLPAPRWQSDGVWVKGDMIYAVALHRLDFFRMNKDANGTRKYIFEPLSDYNIKKIRNCVLRSMGLSSLTKHL
jgi:mRNA interferase MazF